MEGFEKKGQAKAKQVAESQTGSSDEFPPLPGNKIQVSEDDFMVIDSAMQIMASEHQGYLGTLIQNATTKITNMYFHVVDDSTKIALESLVKSEPIMLGQKIKTVDEAAAMVQYLVYFSYRKFDYPIIYKGRKLYTDNLWGCTLRAAQMLFAVVYQKLFPNVEKAKVIDLFKEYKESERSPLNIHRMCDIGSTDYTGKPGEYWNCLTSMLSLKDLLFELPNVSQMLSFLCFHNNMIAFKEFEKSDFGTDEVLVIGEEPDKDVEVFHTKKLVYFVCLLGEAKISEENWECLKLFFGLSTFCGMLGGVGTRAHYIYGYKDDMLLYLDPHNAQHFNPCVVLTYLLSNKKELDHFKETFQSLSNLSSYFFCEDNGRLTPSELESRFSESSTGLEIIESNLPEDPPRKGSDGISGFQVI